MNLDDATALVRSYGAAAEVRDRRAMAVAGMQLTTALTAPSAVDALREVMAELGGGTSPSFVVAGVAEKLGVEL